MKKIVAALSFFLAFSNSYSNNSDALLLLKKSTSEITDTTYECTVATFSKKIYKSANLCGLSDSSVKILRGESSTEILIKDIKSIKFMASGFKKGALISGGIGFALGFLALASLAQALDDGGKSPSIVGPGFLGGIVFAIPSAIIGGVLGTLTAKDKFYDLSKLDFESKRKRVKYLINKYSDR